MKMFNWTFKLSFNADILTCFFLFDDCFRYFFRNLDNFPSNLLVTNLGIFFQSSGHPECGGHCPSLLQV
jgi:hypothetical protein